MQDLVAQDVSPDQWSSILQTVAGWLVQGLTWIPERQQAVFDFVLLGGTPWELALKWLFLLLPAGVLVAGVWCTTASLYTLPFRSGRGGFIVSLVACWWDALRSMWFFWAGVVRFLVVMVGWVWGLLRTFAQLLWRSIKSAVASPFAMLDWTSRQYFQPCVPLFAFLLVLLWSAIEATIFTFTLRPTMSELLAEIAGYEVNATALTALLWMFLFPIIAGSFACIQVLNEAIKSRQVGQIISMVLVELVVAFFEVLFLYRELVDAITPWLAQQGLTLGVGGTLAFAFFGWVGVRGMTWFLFGRYGTPALLGVLARQTITVDQQTTNVPLPTPPDFWRGPVNALKAESEWFKQEARQVFELMSLPVLQLLAAALNFAVVVILGRPMFTLPFHSLDDVLASTPFAKGAPATGERRASTSAAARPAERLS